MSLTASPLPKLPDLRGRTIAVTGASGMIGVYICRSLLRQM